MVVEVEGEEEKVEDAEEVGGVGFERFSTFVKTGPGSGEGRGQRAPGRRYKRGLMQLLLRETGYIGI